MALQAVAGAFPRMIGTLTGSQNFDRLEYERQRAAWANEIPGTLTGYDCPECKNRGYFTEADEEGRHFTRDCKCMATRRSMKRVKRSGLTPLVERCTFDNYETRHEWQRTAKAAALDFATNPRGWLVLSGVPGSGKTHLGVAVCRQLMLDGHESRYILWRELVAKLRAAMNTEQYAEILEPLKSVNTLYLDDFLKTGKNDAPTTSDCSIAFEIIDARYNGGDLITVLSTERTIEEILNFDQALGSRIYERSRDHLLTFAGTEKNYRLRGQGSR